MDVNEVTLNGCLADDVQKEIAAVEIKRMWPGGPLRRRTSKRTSLTPIGYADGGFVGSYVCDGCRRPGDGLYCAREGYRWLCGACRSRGGQKAANEVVGK